MTKPSILPKYEGLSEHKNHGTQDSTCPQLSLKAIETPNVYHEVNSSPLASSNIEPQYPTRINRGILKWQYDSNLNTKAKYPINNCILSHSLLRMHAFTIK